MRHSLHAIPLAAAIGLVAGPALAAPVHPCAADAAKQALKLLRFHTDGDDRAAIDPDGMTLIGSVAALVGKHRFDVIEVEGHVYKGEYRLRLIYAPMPGACVLMGQEIIERSDPY